MKPDVLIEASLAAHRRLEADLQVLNDENARGASLLPRWSRGHVLSHLANKTRDHVWMMEGALRDEVRRPNYEAAPALVEAQAGRCADELRSDVLLAFAALERAWNDFPADRWNRNGIAVPGPRSMADLVGRHLRDVEVHHADLNLDFGPADWSDTFITYELPKRLAGLPKRTDPASLLAWLIGRGGPPELGPW